MPARHHLQEIDSVRDPDVKRVDSFPRANGMITRLAYAKAKEAKIELGPLLKKAGLTAAQLEDPDIPISVREQIDFLNLVADALADERLGFHLALQADLRSLGFLYYVAASSERLDEALQRTARYSSIANEGVMLTYVDGAAVGITFRYIGVSRHLDRYQIEFFVTITLRLCRQLTGRELVPSRVRLMHRGDMHAELLDFFGISIEFDAGADEIVFASQIKQLPIASADPYLNKLLVRYCEDALAHRPHRRGSFQASVENAIAPVLPHGKAQAIEVARRLGLSQRSLARRLALEGLTFSEVLERLRSDLAARYLGDDGLSISQIAWLLGYQEVSAFTHAYKRWTGQTPRAARARRARSNCGG
jgi:AraC-like DNA-binding protein